MKKTRFLKSRTKRNLPEELWSDIFSWLPVKSLLRFRCVSRSWKLIIADPNFGRSHLKRFNNRHESLLFFVQGGYYECVVKNNTTLRTKFSLAFLQSDLESAHVLRTDPDRTGRCNTWSIVSSIDGLFMLTSPWSSESDLMLWNPSIRKTLTVPPSPEISAPLVNADFGLGFDPSIQDYKLVRFSLERGSGLRFLAVYTLGSNSWKSKEFQCRFPQNYIFCYGKRSSIPLNGVLYALAQDKINSPKKLVSFDLRTEVFACFELPVVDRSGSRTYHQAVTVIDDGCSLALVDVSEYNGSIWVLERLRDDIKSWSWIQRYSFATGYSAFNLKFLCWKKNGEMLLKQHFRVICYNLETHLKETMLLKNKKEFNHCDTCPYIESLILHH